MIEVPPQKSSDQLPLESSRYSSLHYVYQLNCILWLISTTVHNYINQNCVVVMFFEIPAVSIITMFQVMYKNNLLSVISSSSLE